MLYHYANFSNLIYGWTWDFVILMPQQGLLRERVYFQFKDPCVGRLARSFPTKLRQPLPYTVRTVRCITFRRNQRGCYFELILTLIYFQSICSCLLIPEENRPVEIREYYGMSIEVDSSMGNISSLHLVEHRVCNNLFPFLLFFSCHLILIMFCLLKRLFF